MVCVCVCAGCMRLGVSPAPAGSLGYRPTCQPLDYAVPVMGALTLAVLVELERPQLVPRPLRPFWRPPF
jgi:hypothetical protein